MERHHSSIGAMGAGGAGTTKEGHGECGQRTNGGVHVLGVVREMGGDRTCLER